MGRQNLGCREPKIPRGFLNCIFPPSAQRVLSNLVGLVEVATHLEVLGLPEQSLDVPAVGLEHGLEVLQGVLVPALPEVEHLDPALENEAVLALRVDLEQAVDVLLRLVDPLDVEEEDAGVVQCLRFNKVSLSGLN